jgi:hypothetical protein
MFFSNIFALLLFLSVLFDVIHGTISIREASYWLSLAMSILYLSRKVEKLKEEKQ